MGIQIWVLFFCQSTNYLIAIRTHKTPGFPPQRKHFGRSTKPKFEDAHLWQQREVGLQTWVLWQQEVVLWQLNLWFSCLVQQGCGCQAIGSSRKKGRGPRFIHSMPTQLGHTCRHKRIERVKFPNSGRTQSSGGVVSTYTPTSSYSYE